MNYNFTNNDVVFIEGFAFKKIQPFYQEKGIFECYLPKKIFIRIWIDRNSIDNLIIFNHFDPIFQSALSFSHYMRSGGSQAFGPVIEYLFHRFTTIKKFNDEIVASLNYKEPPGTFMSEFTPLDKAKELVPEAYQSFEDRFVSALKEYKKALALKTMEWEVKEPIERKQILFHKELEIDTIFYRGRGGHSDTDIVQYKPMKLSESVDFCVLKFVKGDKAEYNANINTFNQKLSAKGPTLEVLQSEILRVVREESKLYADRMALLAKIYQEYKE